MASVLALKVSALSIIIPRYLLLAVEAQTGPGLTDLTRAKLH